MQADLGPAEPAAESGPAPATNGGADEPKPASTEAAAEPATLPTAPPAVETKETNGAAKPAEEAGSEVTGPSVTAEPADEKPDEKPAETVTETTKPTEPAPAEQAPAAAATSANGEAPKPTDNDTEMKDAPTASAETVTEDGVTAPVGAVDNKRKVDEALGPDADADAKASGKKAKTAEGETVEAAAPAKADAAETNGGGAAHAKKGGRPKKQPGKPAPPVGRTERKTRSQGPAV